MKTKLMLILVSLAGGACAQAPRIERTDVNPALIYWKEFLIVSGNSRNAQVEPNHQKAAIDADYETVARAYEEHVRRLGKARRMTAPCDWGSDLSEGPHLYLPHLAHAKRIAQIIRLRTRYHLEKGAPEKAVDELLTGFTLARHVGQEAILVNALVSFGMNGIFLDAIAESFYLLPDDALAALKAGLADLPPGASIASCIATEKAFGAGWLEGELRDLHRRAGDDDARAMAEAKAKVAVMGEIDWETFVARSGGTMSGLLRQLQSLYPFYDEILPLFDLAPQASLDAIEAAVAAPEKTSNPFAELFLSGFGGFRGKELADRVRMSMLSAAIAHRLEGPAGFAEVPDPFTGRPFELTRAFSQGVDRGFVLTSAMRHRVLNRQAFVESAGPRFRLVGESIGEARP